MKLFLVAMLCLAAPAPAHAIVTHEPVVYDDTAIAPLPTHLVADDVATMAVYHATPAITLVDAEVPNTLGPTNPVLAAAASFLGDHLGTLLTFLLSIPAVSALLSVRNKRRLSLAVYHAFHVVEDMDDDESVAGKLDKEKAGLKVVNDYMLAHGWRAPKPGELEVAKMEFKSLNAQADAKVPPTAPAKA